MGHVVAPPRGERGLKCFCVWDACRPLAVAPPRGERGLKSRCAKSFPSPCARRSPSWGAWIEIRCHSWLYPAKACRSPSWGAWIEICVLLIRWSAWCVAPPRGERGLKCQARAVALAMRSRRSPSWGAWIEIRAAGDLQHHTRSLPLVGSVD